MNMVIQNRRRAWLLLLLLLAINQLYFVESAGADSSLTYILIENVNVIPMNRETVLSHHDVVVHDDTITALYPTKSRPVPPGAQIIDGTGKWLIPGLADMHIHINPGWMSSDWPVSPLKLYLAHGVTTVRCFGPRPDINRSTEYIFDWRTKISKGTLIGPAIYSCGPILFGPVKDPEAEVSRQVTRGYHFIKLYSYLTPVEFEKAMQTAQRHGAYVAGHIPMMVGLDSFLGARVNEIAHVEELAWEYAPLDRNRRDLKGGEWVRYAGEKLYTFFKNDLNLSTDALVEKYRESLLHIARQVKEAKTTVSTTLFIDEVIVNKLFYPKNFLERTEVQRLPRSYRNALSLGKEKHQVMFKGLESFAPFKKNLDLAILWALKENHVRLVLGTDSGTGGMGIAPGFSLHEELNIMVRAGYTPYEALAMGTIFASRIVGLMTGQDEFGTIAPGKRADLILLGGNPLDNINSVRDIRGVLAAGRWYSKQTISDWIEP